MFHELDSAMRKQHSATNGVLLAQRVRGRPEHVTEHNERLTLQVVRQRDQNHVENQ